MNHPSILQIYKDKTAYAPHKNTDTLFMLENGDRHFSGALKKALGFITKKQLMDVPLGNCLCISLRWATATITMSAGGANTGER